MGRVRSWRGEGRTAPLPPAVLGVRVGIISLYSCSFFDWSAWRGGGNEAASRTEGGRGAREGREEEEGRTGQPTPRCS